MVKKYHLLCREPVGVSSVKLCVYTFLCKAILRRQTMSGCSSATISHLFVYFYLNVFLYVNVGVDSN